MAPKTPGTMPSTYYLGSEDPELARLELQSQFLDEPTRLLLRTAGIIPGMRVLDLGSGLGHVSRAVGDLVGSDGEVVGVEADPRMIAAAQERTSAPHVRFVEGNVLTYVDGERFDAVVGRLILFHLPDPVAAVRHHLGALRPGGRMVALDYDVGAVRSVPDEPFTRHLGDLVLAGFRLVGADPTIGACLQDHLIAAGADEVAGFGIQPYVVQGSPIGPTMVAGVVRTLAPAIVAHGLATDAELDLDTLADRIAVALDAAGCVLVPPTLVGAWGRRP
jgi:SAM-dependent methyltransferase